MSVSTLPGARMATVTPSAAAFGALLTVAGSPRLGPQPNSLDNAVSCATHWVRLSDGRRPDAMWLEAGAMMQKRVARGEWLRYLRRMRVDRGPLLSREWFEVTRVRDPSGLPEGDYLNVIFISRFAHATQYETVSLAPGAQGWLPVGYVVRPVQRDGTL
ncbi:MAG: hypothetical protein GAK28_04460 [Luteibacter sp.]|uniref:DUF4019 domain-containing protein n=1 Tax=Luteibacter sp. TaxID=1886636 RepID=UPI001386505F|nr:DUF4019 domain-containing protein [Luteibacter sp.]KAF1003806.1 MAG: hypothetical protein GAK28_04460 [Luteibacter sp.]